MITKTYILEHFANKKQNILLIVCILLVTVLSGCNDERISIDQATRLSSEETINLVSGLEIEKTPYVVPFTTGLESMSDADTFTALYKITNNSNYYLNGIPVKINYITQRLYLAPGDCGYYKQQYTINTGPAVDLNLTYDSDSIDDYGATVEPIREIVYSGDLTTKILPSETKSGITCYKAAVKNNTNIDINCKGDGNNMFSYYSYKYENNEYKVIGYPLFSKIGPNKTTDVTIFEYNDTLNELPQDFQIDLVHFNGGKNHKYVAN